MRVSVLASFFVLPPCFALAGCSGDDGSGGTSATDGSTGSTTGTGGSTSGGPTGTSGATDSATGTTGTGGSTSGGSTGGIDPSQLCVDEGLPVAELDVAADGTDWGEKAGDFMVNTQRGPWRLSEEWTGCDSYVFINDLKDASASQWKNSLTEEMFTRSAPNVHYFFMSFGADPEMDSMDMMVLVGGWLAQLDQAGQDHWENRVHFVTDAPAAVEGSVGAFVTARGDQNAFAIDRAQVWDDPGNVQDTTSGSFSPDMRVMGYLSRYYNWRFDLDERLAAEQDVTIVPMMESVTFAPDCVVGDMCFDTQNGPFSNSNNNQVWEVTFPDANTMAGFDTMEFDLTGTCGPDSYSDCGHWDYEAFITLCDDMACTGDNEVIRWITPYSRPGRRRWAFDATPFLPLVKDGGTRYFKFSMVWNMNPSTWDMSFRLSNKGQGTPTDVVPAFRGNKGFNDTYNDGWAQVQFTPPAGTTRVELVALISGHGQDAGNCAEWCNHQHDFTVNGTATHRREFPNMVVSQRCGEEVDNGVIPGQGGNWTPGRAGWCPGQAVQPWRMDITSDVTVGQANTLDYQGLYNGGTPIGGRIRLSSYLVYYQ